MDYFQMPKEHSETKNHFERLINPLVKDAYSEKRCTDLLCIEHIFEVSFTPNQRLINYINGRCNGVVPSKYEVEFTTNRGWVLNKTVNSFKRILSSFGVEIDCGTFTLDYDVYAAKSKITELVSTELLKIVFSDSFGDIEVASNKRCVEVNPSDFEDYDWCPSNLEIDTYIRFYFNDEENIFAFEGDGRQHHELVSQMSVDEEELERIKLKDSYKESWAESQDNVTFLRVRWDDSSTKNSILKLFGELINVFSSKGWGNLTEEYLLSLYYNLNLSPSDYHQKVLEKLAECGAELTQEETCISQSDILSVITCYGDEIKISAAGILSWVDENSYKTNKSIHKDELIKICFDAGIIVHEKYIQYENGVLPDLIATTKTYLAISFSDQPGVIYYKDKSSEKDISYWLKTTSARYILNRAKRKRLSPVKLASRTLIKKRKYLQGLGLELRFHPSFFLTDLRVSERGRKIYQLCCSACLKDANGNWDQVVDFYDTMAISGKAGTPFVEEGGLKDVRFFDERDNKQNYLCYKHLNVNIHPMKVSIDDKLKSKGYPNYKLHFDPSDLKINKYKLQRDIPCWIVDEKTGKVVKKKTKHKNIVTFVNILP